MSDALEQLATAVAHAEAGRFEAAEEASRAILRLDPRSPRALHVLGVVARKTNRLPLAVAVLEDAVRLSPDDPGIHCELGLALSDSHREDEAVARYRRAIEIHPLYGDACLNLAAALDRLEQPEAALPWAERAAELLPQNPIAHFNLGNVLRALGKLDEASAAFDSAIRLDPSFANAHWNQACCRLLAGDFATGWREYEWRAQAGEVALDNYSRQRWQGEPIDGQTILVHAEQGIGDEILFASCLPDLIARAGHCVVVCEPRLEKLFARSFPQASVHGSARRRDRAGPRLREPIDKQIPAGSLPLYFRSTRQSFPNRRHFLVPEAERQAEWRKRYDDLGPGLKIGISWRAGGQPSERRKRTTGLDLWREVFAVPGVHLINLQYGECADELAATRRELGATIHELEGADPLVDLDAFAAKIAALDLVLSVGNATVHLAGALGVSAWAVLPTIPGWRWMIAGRESPWYPSVRLFRQRERGQWAPVFGEVADALFELVHSQHPDGRPQAKTARAVGNSRPIENTTSPSPAASISGRDAKPAAPFDPDAVFDEAMKCIDRGDRGAAESHCSQILDHFPRHVPALNLLGQIARQTGRHELAIRTLGRAVAVADCHPLVRLNLALAQHEVGRLEQAAESYRSAVALDPRLADAHFGLGKVLRARGRSVEAIAAFEQTVALKPEHHKALNFLGGCYLETARWADAERSFRAAIQLQADYMAAHNNLGMALERQGRLSEALACYDRAIELDEHCLQAVNNLANVLDRLGQQAVAALVRKQSGALRAAG
jgi:tetratricopeptide (TPR) repeat protein